MSIPMTPETQARRTKCSSCDRRCLRMYVAGIDAEVVLTASTRRVNAGWLLCGRCAVVARAAPPVAPPTAEQLARTEAEIAWAKAVTDAMWLPGEERAAALAKAREAWTRAA